MVFLVKTATNSLQKCKEILKFQRVLDIGPLRWSRRVYLLLLTAAALLPGPPPSSFSLLLAFEKMHDAAWLICTVERPNHHIARWPCPPLEDASEM